MAVLKWPVSQLDKRKCQVGQKPVYRLSGIICIPGLYSGPVFGSRCTRCCPLPFSRLPISSFSFSTVRLNCKTFIQFLRFLGRLVITRAFSSSLHLSSFLTLFLLSRMLLASCSFCYTGGHFLSTRANVICARDRYMVSFRGRRKKKIRDDKEGREAKARGCLWVNAHHAGTKRTNWNARERGRRGGWWSIGLFRGLEFDFSFRRRGGYISYTVSFLHFSSLLLLLLFFFFPLCIPYFSSPKKSTPSFPITCSIHPILSYRGFWRFSRCARTIAAEGCHREENASRSDELSRRIGFALGMTWRFLDMIARIMHTYVSRDLSWTVSSTKRERKKD